MRPVMRNSHGAKLSISKTAVVHVALARLAEAEGVDREHAAAS